MTWVVRGGVLTLFMAVTYAEAGLPWWASLPIGLAAIAYAARPLKPAA